MHRYVYIMNIYINIYIYILCYYTYNFVKELIHI